MCIRDRLLEEAQHLPARPGIQRAGGLHLADALPLFCGHQVHADAGLRDAAAAQACLLYTSWAKAEEDSLRGLFLRDLKQQLAQAQTEEDRQRVTMAARFGLAALDHRDLG